MNHICAAQLTPDGVWIVYRVELFNDTEQSLQVDVLKNRHLQFCSVLVGPHSFLAINFRHGSTTFHEANTLEAGAPIFLSSGDLLEVVSPDGPPPRAQWTYLERGFGAAIPSLAELEAESARQAARQAQRQAEIQAGLATLQQRLKIPADGIFGPQTMKALSALDEAEQRAGLATLQQFHPSALLGTPKQAPTPSPPKPPPTRKIRLKK